jgi:hypothetical protein
VKLGETTLGDNELVRPSSKVPLTAAVLSQAKLKHFLSQQELRRRDCHIPCCALVNYCYSPFQRLYHSRNDQSSITFMGLDYLSFDYLLNKFCPLCLCYSPYTVNGKVVVLRDAAVRKGIGRVHWILQVVLVWCWGEPEQGFTVCFANGFWSKTFCA